MTTDALLARRNRKTALVVVGVLLATTILPWAYAPLYRQVCSMLGINSDLGRKKIGSADFQASAAGAGVGSVPVRFMGISGTLPIAITPLKVSDQVPLGKTYTVMYRLENKTDRPLDYRAIHSTLPADGPGFTLIKCFCDDHRIIPARAVEEWPVVFKLDEKTPARGLTVAYTLFDYDPAANGTKR